MQNEPKQPFSLEYSPIEMISGSFPVQIWNKEKYRLKDEKISKLHFHNCLEIGYCFEGGGIFLIDGKILTFGKGDASVIFAKQVHIAQSEKNTESLWSFISLDHEKLLSEIPLQELTKILKLNSSKSSVSGIFSSKEYNSINTIVFNIITELMEEKSNYESAIKSLLWLLFIELGRVKNLTSLEEVCIQNDNSIRLLPALDYLSRNYENQIYINDLACLCNTSVRNFRRLFNQTFNYSPLDYINKFRIEMSGILLLNSDYSILEIADKSGFQTLSSFNRHFKNIMRVSPSEWRKKAKQSER